MVRHMVWCRPSPAVCPPHTEQPLRRAPAWLPSRPKDLTMRLESARALQVFRCAHATLIRHPNHMEKKNVEHSSNKTYPVNLIFKKQYLESIPRRYFYHQDKHVSPNVFVLSKEIDLIFDTCCKKSEIASVFCSMYLLTRSTQCEKLCFISF